MYRMVVAVVLLAGGAAAAQAVTVYRCPGDADEAYFTDRPCPGGRQQALDGGAVATVPGLAAEERARVGRLDREQAARTRALDAQHFAESRARARFEVVRLRNCAAAQAGLERVQQIKRRGYAAASAADLQARKRKYALQVERNCG
jgi:hypothetical protein